MRLLVIVVIGVLVAAGVAFGLGRSGLTAAQRNAVLVSVTTDAGEPVRGLGPGDFVVRGQGHDLRIEGAKPATEPLAVVVVLDGFSSSMASDARGAMRTVIASAQSDFVGARVGLMVRDGAGTPQMHHAGAGGEALERQVSRFFEHTNAPLLDSILVASETLAHERSGRRAIVVVTLHAGGDLDGLAPSRVARAVRESGASLWIVEVGRGLPLGSSVGQVLEHVPTSSGGRRISSSLAAMIASVRQTMAAIAAQYTVAYQPHPSHAGETPRIGVKRDGVRVLAPSWPVS